MMINATPTKSPDPKMLTRSKVHFSVAIQRGTNPIIVDPRKRHIENKNNSKRLFIKLVLNKMISEKLKHLYEEENKSLAP